MSDDDIDDDDNNDGDDDDADNVKIKFHNLRKDRDRANLLFLVFTQRERKRLVVKSPFPTFLIFPDNKEGSCLATHD